MSKKLHTGSEFCFYIVDVKMDVSSVMMATAMTVAVAMNACGFINPPFLYK